MGKLYSLIKSLIALCLRLFSITVFMTLVVISLVAIGLMTNTNMPSVYSYESKVEISSIDSDVEYDGISVAIVEDEQYKRFKVDGYNVASAKGEVEDSVYKDCIILNSIDILGFEIQYPSRVKYAFITSNVEASSLEGYRAELVQKYSEDAYAKQLVDLVSYVSVGMSRIFGEQGSGGILAAWACAIVALLFAIMSLIGIIASIVRLVLLVKPTSVGDTEQDIKDFYSINNVSRRNGD